MKYQDLLDAQFKYGISKEDIIKDKEYENILKNVIIAPWWSHDMFDNIGFEIEQLGEKIYNFYNDEISFTFIELKRIGAPAIMDFILSLGVTKCEKLIFLGSAGSLDKNIKIGDIVVPTYSICGDGASRYLNKNLEDEFLKEEYPSEKITNKLIEVLENNNIIFHHVPNFSIDTVFAQLYHIDKIRDHNVKTIEMETALVFKCANIMNIDATALFCISDNILLNKTLYSGRNNKENEYRHKVRYNIIPRIVLELLKDKKKNNS